MAEDPAAQQPASTLSDAPAAEPTTGPAAAEPTSAPPAPTLPPAAVPVPDTGYTPAGVPTLEGVRAKIETRFGTALGATELAEAGLSLCSSTPARKRLKTSWPRSGPPCPSRTDRYPTGGE
jgi:hypothetical protein